MTNSYTLVDVIMTQSHGLKSSMPGTAEDGRLLIARINNGISELWCGTDDGVELLSGAKIDFSNLNTTGEDYFVKTSTQVRDCIFKAPNGLPSVSGNIISLPTGTTLLCVNGVDSNRVGVNEKITTTSALSASVTWTGADAGVVFFNKTNTSLIFYPLSAYGRGTSAPTGSTNMIWYNPNTNKYKITSNLGSTWSDIVATEIARFSTDSNGDIVEFNSYHPLTAATEDDIVVLQNKIKEESEKRNQEQIGALQFTLDFMGPLPDNCIDLNGAEVSRTTYANLFAIYGTTYGAGDGSTTFNLPDFRGKVIYGDVVSGYIEPELPNITGSITLTNLWPTGNGADGCLVVQSSELGNLAGDGGTRVITMRTLFDASRSSSIYKNGGTVKTAGIKARVYTRYQ